MTERYEFRGRLMTIPELAAVAGITASAMGQRLYRCGSVEEAVSLPRRNAPRRWRFRGEELTTREVADRLGVDIKRAYYLLRTGRVGGDGE